MSVDMWNCHSWPLDVSNNLSEYFMSSSVHIHFAFGYHEQHWTVKSWLCPLAFFYRQERGGLSARPPPPPPLPPPSPWMGHFRASYSLLVWYGIPVHVAVKLICLTIGLWIFLSKDNVLLLLQYDTRGVHLPLVSVYLYMHWYFLIFSHWTVKRLLCSMTVLTGGVHLPLSLNDTNEQWRDHSVLWQCWPGGVHLPLVSTCVLYALVFPYIFLLVDCFKWALIGDIEKCTVHSVLWQFWRGGPSAFGIYMFSLCTGISLYFLISWLFRMGSHWQHWKA